LDADSAFSGNASLIYLSINAYGHSGPWAERPGFDQNGQVATGFARCEGEARPAADGSALPTFSPVFYLNDFLTGYLAAAGMMTALLRRATEGGAYHVKLSLSRTAMWVQDLGYVPRSEYEKCPEQDKYAAELETFGTTYGDITELAPAVTFGGENIRVPLTRLVPFGADRASWE
jgi:crotonobetainyl-CoA:carnitine CoA-transferase CaiB-like acyl-CoA transferase